MSNLASRIQQENQQRAQEQSKKVAVKKASFSPGEKLLGLLFGAVLCLGSVQIISNHAAIYEVNKEIQDIEAKIQDQQKVNGDLEVQVAELSTYERIWEKATKELGLQLNDNVKVVQE